MREELIEDIVTRTDFGASVQAPEETIVRKLLRE
jgi:hypothetical protein